MIVSAGIIGPVIVIGPVGRAVGETGRFIGQGEQRIALGAGKPAAALFPGKEHDKTAGQQQTEEDGDRYDGHAWNVCAQYRPYCAARLRMGCD
jgi:hypothetical protein